MACGPAMSSPSAWPATGAVRRSWWLPRPKPTIQTPCAMQSPAGSRKPSVCPPAMSCSSRRARFPRPPRASSSARWPAPATWPRSSSPPDTLLFGRLPALHACRGPESGSCRRRKPGRAGRLVGGDLVLVAEGEADVVEALEQAPSGEVVEGEAGFDVGRFGREGPALDVDHHEQVGVVDEGVEQGPPHLGFDLYGQEPGLGAVGAEDVGEAGGHHRLEAVVLEGPHGVLA